MKRLAVCALLVAPLMAAPLAALGAATNPDGHFYTAAARGGLGEVELARLAQEKSSDAKVKDFAGMMIKDHSAANEELLSLAASKSIKLPTGPGTRVDAQKVKLEALSGSGFDKAYIKDQVKAHRDTVALLKKEISSGQDEDAKAFARKVLPTVEDHLKAIDSIADSVGIKR